MSNFNLVKIRVDYQDIKKEWPNNIFDDRLVNPRTGKEGIFLEDTFLSKKDYKNFKKNNPDFPDICYNEHLNQIDLVVEYRIDRASTIRKTQKIDKRYRKYLTIIEKLFLFIFRK